MRAILDITAYLSAIVLVWGIGDGWTFSDSSLRAMATIAVGFVSGYFIRSLRRSERRAKEEQA